MADVRVDHDSGVGMGVVLGVILTIVVALVVLWFAFGANRFGSAGMMGSQAGDSQSNQNNETSINITVPTPDINIVVPAQQPAVPSLTPAVKP